ncbi:MAG: hypothetical protein ACJ70X_09525, partial [Nitrososphaera sp.]
AVCAPVTKTKMMHRAIIMDRGLMAKSLPLVKLLRLGGADIIYIHHAKGMTFRRPHRIGL